MLRAGDYNTSTLDSAFGTDPKPINGLKCPAGKPNELLGRKRARFIRTRSEIKSREILQDFSLDGGSFTCGNEQNLPWETFRDTLILLERLNKHSKPIKCDAIHFRWWCKSIKGCGFELLYCQASFYANTARVHTHAVPIGFPAVNHTTPRRHVHYCAKIQIHPSWNIKDGAEWPAEETRTPFLQLVYQTLIHKHLSLLSTYSRLEGLNANV